MIKNIKIISILLIIICILILVSLKVSESCDKSVQNKIIDNVFNVQINQNTEEIPLTNEYLGYIYIPKYDVKRLIKTGTDSNILDEGYVGLHHLSGSLNKHDLIILAGHNISNVFGNLHEILSGDVIYIRGKEFDRKFIVYNKAYVNEYDTSFFYNRNDELLLITCTSKKGERLLVFLKEEL